MKTIRLGNDISIQWTITRLGEPEDFYGKNLTVQLIDKLGNPQVFDYALQENVIIGTFFGKDQVTNGTYRLLLVENEGEENMVTLDYIDCFCLSNKMKNQTSNGSDTTSTINTEVIEVTSDIDLAPDLSQFVTKDYLDASYYDKDEIDEMISEIPALDTYTKSQIDEKIADVSNNIPTKVSDLDNDSGYLVSDDVSTFVTEDDLQGYAKTEDIPTKVSELDNDEGYITSEDASIFLTENDVSTFITEDDLNGYAKTEDIPTKVSELDNDEGYLVPDDVSTFVKEDYLAQVATTGDYDDLINKPTIPEVPTNVSAFTNDAGYLVANDVSTLVDESELSNVAFSGDYGDLENKPDLTHYFDDAAYDSSTKRINFKHDNTIVAFIDATEFIKDGMVDNVVIENGYVVITFNTDAGKEAIRIPITDIFNPANYYDKTAIDQLLQGKQDTIVDLGQIRLDASAGRIAYGWGNHAEAGYLVQNDVSTFITRDDASIYLTENDVSTFITEDDLQGYAKTEDIPTKVSELDNDEGYLVSDDVSTFLTIEDVSTFITKNDASIYLTAVDISTFITENDVSTFITKEDASVYLTAVDVSTFITDNDVSTFITADDVSTFITEEDASIYLTANDVSTFITSNDVSTFVTLADVSSGFEVKAWKGTQAQYDQLQVIEQNKLYIILPTT